MLGLLGLLGLLVPVLALVGLATTPAPAAASTGGAPDVNRHPGVGLLVFYGEDGSRSSCSGTLVTPTVVLTAAHCTDGTRGLTLVIFDSVIAESPPAPLPAAANPAVGYTPADLAGYRYGTAYTHPQYSDFTDRRNWNDLGVVRLSAPATGVPTSQIAPVGSLDPLAGAQLPKTLFTAVGYGSEVRKPESGPQKPQPMSYPLIRRYVDMPGQKLTPQILRTNGNPHDPRGTGGSCFGDSGGPVYYGGRIVAVTSYVSTANCRYLGGSQRVDIRVAQDWLATFGVTA